MATVFLFINHNRERQVLKIICESYGYDVLQLPLEDSSLPQLLQYIPESVIIDIPDNAKKHIGFIKQIRKQPKLNAVRLLCYGDIHSTETILDITDCGNTTYYNRPLRTQNIRQILRPKNNHASLHRNISEGYEGELDDTAQIMDPETPPSQRIEIMVNRIGELLAFPFTIAKVLSITQSSTTGAGDLAQAIEIDPVIVSAILKVANSAFYGRAGKSISSIKDAIVRIGFSETKNIAVSLSIMLLFSDEENSIGFDRKEFWYHSLSAAVIAGKIAQKAGFKRAEIPFVSGLLHDFGIILLDEFFPTFLFSTLRSATQKGIPFVQEQKMRWGMTHNDVVCKLFEQWNMPEEILLPLQKWQQATTFSHATSPEMTLLVHAVRVADIIAKSLEFGRECDEYVTPIPTELFKEFRITEQVGDQFFNDIDTDINMFSTYLEIEREPFKFTRDIPKSARLATINFIDLSGTLFNPIEFYLIMQQFQFQYKKDIEDITESHTPPELIMIHCNDQTRENDILPFTNVKNTAKEKDDKTSDEKIIEPELLPVLIIGADSRRDYFNKLPSNAAFLSEEIDLRVLAFSIQRLLLGQPLENKADKIKTADSSLHNGAKQIKPSIATRILGKNTIIITLKGDIKIDVMKELKQLISTLLTKTKTIVINFSEVNSCSDNLLVILDEFRKIVRQKDVVLVLCSLGKQGKKSNSIAISDTIQQIGSDEQLIKHIQLIKSGNTK